MFWLMMMSKSFKRIRRRLKAFLYFAIVIVFQATRVKTPPVKTRIAKAHSFTIRTWQSILRPKPLPQVHPI